MTSQIKSTAARVLSTGEATDEETASLAASVLGSDLTPSTTKTRKDLERIIKKLADTEGQSDRVAMARAELAKL